MKSLLRIFILITGLSLTGCQTLNNQYYNIDHNHIAAQQLLNYVKVRLTTQAPLIVASFVNINDLTNSSALGRSIAQQFGTVFTRNHYKVIEVLLRKNIYIQQQNGEFLLSRELVSISQGHQAQAVLVGTYAVGKTRVYITAKVVDADTNIIISAYDYSIPIDKDTIALLNN